MHFWFLVLTLTNAASSGQLSKKQQQDLWRRQMSLLDSVGHGERQEIEESKRLGLVSRRSSLRNELLESFSNISLSGAKTILELSAPDKQNCYKIIGLHPPETTLEMKVNPKLEPSGTGTFVYKQDLCIKIDDCVHCKELNALKEDMDLNKVLDGSPSWKCKYEEYRQVVNECCEVEWLIYYHASHKKLYEETRRETEKNYAKWYGNKQ